LRAVVSFEETPPVLRCSGDESRATQGCRRPAMSRALKADADVVVELAELAFADPSLMVDLAMLSRRLRRRDKSVVLRQPQPQIHKLIEMVGLDRLPGVRIEGPAPALA
jgi:anti-anti-sigma regulatory factor